MRAALFIASSAPFASRFLPGSRRGTDSCCPQSSVRTSAQQPASRFPSPRYPSVKRSLIFPLTRRLLVWYNLFRRVLRLPARRFLFLALASLLALLFTIQI